jgi:hypothetical protein
MQTPKPEEIYRHFKGKNYRIIGIANDSENPDKKIVIYEQLYASENALGTLWARNLEDFIGDKIFDKDTKVGDRIFRAGERVKKFTLIEKI